MILEGCGVFLFESLVCNYYSVAKIITIIKKRKYFNKILMRIKLIHRPVRALDHEALDGFHGLVDGLVDDGFLGGFPLT